MLKEGWNVYFSCSKLTNDVKRGIDYGVTLVCETSINGFFKKFQG